MQQNQSSFVSIPFPVPIQIELEKNFDFKNMELDQKKLRFFVKKYHQYRARKVTQTLELESRETTKHLQFFILASIDTC